MGVDMVFADIDWEDASDEDGFHVNWNEMRRAKENMRRVGMLTPDAPLPKYGTVPDKVYFSAGYHDAPGIPPHKFGSNDDWHITVAECSSALVLWRRAAPETVAAVLGDCPWFPEWIDYLGRAVKRGGILVG